MQISESWADRITRSGDLVFAAGNRMEIFDASDPDSPVLVGSYQTGSRVRHIEVLGDLAFLSVNLGFEVVDISDPSNPAFQYALDIGSHLEEIQIVDSRAYLLGTRGLSIYNIEDPTSPVLIGFYHPSFDIQEMQVVGTRVYINGVGSDIIVIDAAIPSPLRLLGTYSAPGSGRVLFDFDDTIAYIINESGLNIVDFADPASPNHLGSAQTPIRLERPRLVGDTLYAPAGGYGVFEYDVADPSLPVYAGSIACDGYALELVSVGSGLIVASGSGVWRIDPLQASDTFVSSLPLETSTADLVVRGSTAFIADLDAGLRVVSVEDPENPVQVGSYSGMERVDWVSVSGDTVYTVDAVSALIHSVDVSDPAAPSFLWEYMTPNPPLSITAEGDMVVVGENGGIRILDVSDPKSPIERGYFQRDRRFDNFSLKDNLLFATGSAVLTAIDIEDPENPQQLGELLIPHNLTAVQSDGNYAYIGIRNPESDPGRGALQMVVVDIRDPAMMRMVAEYSNNDAYSYLELFLRDSRIFAARRTGGIDILDVEDPTEPVLRATYGDYRNKYSGIQIGDSIGYLTGDFGLEIVRMGTHCSQCPVDITGDGILDIADVFAYLDLFGLLDPAADFTGDGVLDIFDVFAFLDAYSAGCP
ncbi:MAG: hypothetical protein KC996_00045 [Phycisphaerales bacterium]|nr:hypothetical protein [Phycisphaerales bacterium]